MRNLGQAIGIAVPSLWLSDQLKGDALAVSLHTIFCMLVVLVKNTAIFRLFSTR
ncbi:hypothetical protein [Bacillus toyonensis]|uniref:hypothetical protein n=1 Tax=Bacillus toyonensis TaxID=155322 RepID=UPI001C3F4283|nr:hypothetical protein [Bacillus toyonensis]